METKLCPKCHLEKDASEFNWKNKSANIRFWCCRPCSREDNRRRYKRDKQYYVDKAGKRNKRIYLENRARVLEYLKDHPCVDCGYSDFRALEFDHRDRNEKSGDVSTIVRSGCWATIASEIAKCDVRCANCHRIRTHTQMGWHGADSSLPVDIALKV